MVNLPSEVFAHTQLSSRLWKSDLITGCPEEIVLAEYQSRGYQGAWCEGSTLFILMKSACFPALVKGKPSSKRQYARFSLFHNDCIKLALKNKQIKQILEKTNTYVLEMQATEILNDGRTKKQYPQVSVKNVLNLWKALGNKKLLDIINIFMTNPGNYKSGWPDITLTRGNELKFVEVKTPTDSLQPSQERIINEFAIPLGLPFSIAHLERKK